MAVVEIGSERLNIEPRREVLRLWPALAGARIDLVDHFGSICDVGSGCL
jgi:hypothetical protein